jgi:hypothetical protein
MMIGQRTRGKKDVWGVRPGAADMRKEWIKAFLKRVALIDLAASGLKDESASEQIVRSCSAQAITAWPIIWYWRK